MTVTFKALFNGDTKAYVRITTGELGALLAGKERPSDVTIESVDERWGIDREDGYTFSRAFIEAWSTSFLRDDKMDLLAIANPPISAVGFRLAQLAIRGVVTSAYGNNRVSIDDGTGAVEVEAPDLDDRTKLVEMVRHSEPVLVFCDMGTLDNAVVARRIITGRGGPLFEVPAWLIDRYSADEQNILWGGLPSEPLHVEELLGGHLSVLGGWAGREAPRERSEETGKLVIVQGRVRDDAASPLILEDVHKPELAIAVLGPRAGAYETGRVATVTGHVVLLGPEQMTRSVPHFVAVRGVRMARPWPTPPVERRSYATIDRDDAEGISSMVVHQWNDHRLETQVRVVATHDDCLVVEYMADFDAMGAESWVPVQEPANEARLLAEAALRLQLKTKE